MAAGFLLANEAAAQGGLAKLPTSRARSAQPKRRADEHITSYNNFYEFAPGAGDGPKNNSKNFAPALEDQDRRLVAKPGDYDIDDFIKPHMLEERVSHAVRRGVVVRDSVGIPMAEVIKAWSRRRRPSSSR